MATHLPVPAQMDMKGDLPNNWTFFKTQWNDYEVATELSEKDASIRVTTLRSVMGKECLRVLQTLSLSDDEAKNPVAVIKALGDYFTPKRNVVYERYVFGTANQGANESVDQYVTRLRQLAATCAFNDAVDEFIRDRLVLGTTDNSARARMFREKNLSLDSAIDICKVSELSNIQLKQIQNSESEVQYIKPKQRTQPSKGDYSVNNKGKLKRCKYCDQSHNKGSRNCPAYGKRCVKCKRLHHFSSVCKSTKKSANFCDTQQGYSSDSDQSVLMVQHTLNNVKETRHTLTIPLSLSPEKNTQGVTIQCILDTGTTCNVISIDDLNKISRKAVVRKSNTKLNLYDGSYMRPLGVCTLHTVHKGKRYKLRFEVVTTKTARKPLLSANTCQTMQLISVDIPDSVNNITTNTAEAILDKYDDVFEGLGSLPGKVNLQTDPQVHPVQHTPRKMPLALKKEVKAKLDDMEKRGIICPVTEPADWISSMVVVKKGPKLRICLDPSDLNKALKRSHFPMPTIEEILPRLKNAKVFSVLDASDGYNQCRLDERSSYLTTFWTPFQRYRWLRLPFGIKTASEEYQRRQTEALQGVPGIEIVADDLLVCGYGDTIQDAIQNHNHNLTKLMMRCREKNLKLNRKKVQLCKTEVPYIGHLLTAEGVKPDPNKIAAIRDMPRPTNVKEVQRFLGFINYLSKFLPHLSEVCEPLRRLCEKQNEFCWESQQHEAFEKAKQLVTMEPILAYYDVNKPVTIQCDSSDKALGCTILQDDKPIAFASTTLSASQQRYAVIEKEMLAICFATKKFRNYILGKDDVTIETDHKPLEAIFKKSILAAPIRLQWMMLQLQRYNLRVKYRKGSEQYIADLLSRATPLNCKPDAESQSFDVFCHELDNLNYAEYTSVSSNSQTAIKIATENDQTLQVLKSTIMRGWPNSIDQVQPLIQEYWNFRDEITVQDGILYKGLRMIIPKSMRSDMLKKIHSSHLGTEACLRKASDSLFWPKMRQSITSLVNSCHICAEINKTQQKEPMQTPKLPTRPWSKIAVDEFQHERKSYLLTVDYYSDYFEIDRLYSSTSKSIIKILQAHLARHGIPDEVITDNHPNLVSDEFSKFADEWKFDHISISPGHSRSNGKVESAVAIAKTLIKKVQRSNTNIYQALLEWRNTPTVNMNSSPVQRLFSRRTKTLLPINQKLLQPEIQMDVTKKIENKRQIAKYYYDRNAKPLPKLEIGQPVYVQPISGHDSSTWKPAVCTQKLSDKSYIVQSNNGNAYRRNRVHLKPNITNHEYKDTTADNEIPMVIDDTHMQSNKDKSSFGAQSLKSSDMQDTQQRENSTPRTMPRRSSRKKTPHIPYTHIP